MNLRDVAEVEDLSEPEFAYHDDVLAFVPMFFSPHCVPKGIVVGFRNNKKN